MADFFSNVISEEFDKALNGGLAFAKGEFVSDEQKEAVIKQIADATGLPAATEADNGKFLRIVDGNPAWATVQNAAEVSF